jgi:hypothetical protein
MLKEAGLTAWPVLISTREYHNLNSDFPAVFFNHCIAAIKLGEKVIFMDPTAQTCAFGDLPADDQDRDVLAFKEDGYAILQTPLFGASHNLIKQNLQVSVNNDETIRARKSISTFGRYDQGQRYWLLFTPPELIKQTLTEKIQETSIGSILNSYRVQNLDDLGNPIVLSYDFKGPEYFIKGGNLRIAPQLTSVDTSLVAQDTRRFPIDFTILDAKETSVEITLPKNFTVRYLPDSIDEDSPWLRFKVEYAYKDGKIFFTQTAEFKKNAVSTDDYGKFKAFFEGLGTKIKQRIILEKATGNGAH